MCSETTKSEYANSSAILKKKRKRRLHELREERHGPRSAIAIVASNVTEPAKELTEARESTEEIAVTDSTGQKENVIGSAKNESATGPSENENEAETVSESETGMPETQKRIGNGSGSPCG